MGETFSLFACEADDTVWCLVEGVCEFGVPFAFSGPCLRFLGEVRGIYGRGTSTFWLRSIFKFESLLAEKTANV